MNWFGKNLLILLAFSATVGLSAATDRSVFAKIKVEVKLEQPPVVNVSRTPSSNPRIVLSQRWLVVKVTYSPQSPREGGPNQSTFIDGVKMRVSTTFPIGGVSRKDAYGLFRGEQTLWTVCCDGRQHVAMMFVPPHLLQRYLYMLEPYTGMRSPNKGGFRTEVVFFDRSGAELGRGYFGVPGTLDKQEAGFRRLEKEIPSGCVVDGAFMKRGDTPWRTMEPDQFDLVKPDDVKLPEAPVPPRAGVVQRGQRRGSRQSAPGPKLGGE